MDFEFIKEFTPMFVKAGIFTVKLSLYGILLSLVIGIFCTLVKFYKVKILTPLTNSYIEVSRNTPLLIQLFFLYYGLSKFGLNLRQAAARPLNLPSLFCLCLAILA